MAAGDAIGCNYREDRVVRGETPLPSHPAESKRPFKAQPSGDITGLMKGTVAQRVDRRGGEKGHPVKSQNGRQ